MRDLASLTDYRPSLIGTLSTIGGTAVGAPVDCLGFADAIALLSAGAVTGSAGAGIFLDVKIQESATATGTGANWSDITDGTVNGSFDFDQLSIGHGVDAGTWISYQVGKVAEHICGKDYNRKRYIRAHATLSGTVGLGPKISVGFLLNRPNDTLYITNATEYGSTNVELTQLL